MGGVNSAAELYNRRKIGWYLRYNRWFFKKKGVVFGKHFNVFNRVYLRGAGTIIIGDCFTFTSGDSINPISRNLQGCINTVKKGVIKIGNNVGISSATLWAQKSIEIGNHVNIGANCLLIDNDAHPINYLERRYPPTENNVSASPIVIEDDVWIGANCIILKGVTIGARSIVGAGSVVTQSIPCDSIAAGNPAKVVKLIVK